MTRIKEKICDKVIFKNLIGAHNEDFQKIRIDRHFLHLTKVFYENPKLISYLKMEN
jgi:hypothetical protein